MRPAKTEPWYPDVCDQLREAKRQRRRAERQWLDTGLTIHKQLYNAAKRFVTNIVRKAKTNIFSNEIVPCVTSKQFFGVSSECGRRTNTPFPTVYPSSVLPEIFCDVFVRKLSDILDDLDRLASASPLAPAVRSADCATSFVSFQPVSQEEIRKIIMKSKPTICSLDLVPTPLLLDCLDVLLPSLKHVVNNSPISGHFPTLFKTAVVKPLLKISTLDKKQLKYYRPVSTLSGVSKVIEKVVHQQLFAYLNAFSLLPESHRHGGLVVKASAS